MRLTGLATCRAHNPLQRGSPRPFLSASRETAHRPARRERTRASIRVAISRCKDRAHAFAHLAASAEHRLDQLHHAVIHLGIRRLGIDR
jgi:hypothetical protein